MQYLFDYILGLFLQETVQFQSTCVFLLVCITSLVAVHAII